MQNEDRFYSPQTLWQNSWFHWAQLVYGQTAGSESHLNLQETKQTFIGLLMDENIYMVENQIFIAWMKIDTSKWFRDSNIDRKTEKIQEYNTQRV